MADYSNTHGAETPVTLPAVLRAQVARRGDAPFLITEAAALTYRDLDLLSNRVARGVERLGIGTGEAVLVMLPNGSDFIALWIGLAKRTAIEVPVNTSYRGTILAHVIRDSGAATMIIDVAYLENLAELLPGLPDLKRLILHGGPAPAGLGARLSGLELLDFDVLTRESSDAVPDLAAPWTLMAVMYTSGTTGPSKGVMITHAHAYHYALSCVEQLDLRPDDAYYAPLPLFHIAGQWAVVYAACIAGARAVLPARFSVESFWQDVARHKVTATFLLGAMGNFLHRAPPRAEDAQTPLSKALIVPLFPAFEEFKARFRVQVTTTYGSTEVNVPVRAGFDLADPRTCGKIADHLFEVQIVDEHDRPLPNGTVGELVLRPRQPWIVMAGYWRHPEWTAQAWRNLWLHSGDALYRDDAGNLYFADRVKDCIRRRGENISSIEVENEINAHPAVLECAVIPVAAKETEQEVMAVVVAKPGETVDPAELIAFLEPRMAYFMVPRYIDCRDALQKTPTGKIKKHALRGEGLTATTWDRVAAGIKIRK